MIKFNNTEIVGWEAAVRGMRNPLNSWDKSDSKFNFIETYVDEFGEFDLERDVKLGKNDLNLMKRLRNAGTDHRKFMRMITVYVDITAPLYWWKEFDTYKIGTVANSCSTMHKIAEKRFTIKDFSCEHLFNEDNGEEDQEHYNLFLDQMKLNVIMLNRARDRYLKTKDKKYWWQMIQLLPSSYNQRRTVAMNYEVLANIYKSRKDHKLDEWSKGFIEWIESLPYAKELIIGEKDG